MIRKIRVGFGEKFDHFDTEFFVNRDSRNAAHSVAAVNDGMVYRFFCKPVDADLLAEALQSAIEEYRFATDNKAEIHNLRVMAASAERTRKSFLAMMNHELRTPLNHILGFSSLLEQRCRQKGEVEMARQLIESMSMRHVP